MCIRDRGSSEAVGNLYLGSYAHATDYDFLEEKKITGVLSALHYCMDLYKGKIAHKIINLDDNKSENITTILPDAIKFVEEGLKTGNVLVHCAAGISRSSSIVIAFLIVSKNMSYDDAFQFVQERRSMIQPNEGFERQLKILSSKRGISQVA
eukprot:TRINITY_DN14528_c0_g1_i2.p1 TRINITY_DN14528_c0_g1~~TRINITY_DN14528_c0_g1_i2.p1  ORF type:complete len:171 (-),score=35.14 TRINITY_DN14528_c0_g1_i2:16-471(-)